MAKDYAKGTIKGTAMWAHLDAPETIQGVETDKFAISLIPTKEDLDAFLAECETVWAEFLEQPENKKKRLKGEPNFGVREDDDGNNILKFKANATLKLKSGEVKNRSVPIFDGMGNVITKKVRSILGNGSDIIVAYQLFPFIFSANNFGVSLRLDGVQVLKLVEYGGSQSAEGLGFTKHEGAFNGEDLPDEEVNEDDIPFTDGEDDNGDF